MRIHLIAIVTLCELAFCAGCLAQLEQTSRFATPLETPYGFTWVGTAGNNGCYAAYTFTGSGGLTQGVYRFPPNGNADWFRTMPEDITFRENFGAWASTSDNGFVFARSGGDSDFSAPDSIAVSICRMAPDGSAQWSRTLRAIVPTLPAYLLPDIDVDDQDAIHLLMSSVEGLTVVMAITAEGDHQWTRRIPVPPGMIAVAITADGAGGNRVICTTRTTTDQGYFMVLHFAANGSLVEARSHSPAQPQTQVEMFDACATLDGGMLVAGVRNTGTGFDTAFLMRLAANGNVVWVNDHEVGSDLLDSFHQGAVSATPDGTFHVNYVHGTFQVDQNGVLIEAKSLEPVVGANGSEWMRLYSPHFVAVGGSVIAGGQYQAYDEISDQWTTEPALLPLNAGVDCFWTEQEMLVTPSTSMWTTLSVPFETLESITLIEEGTDPQPYSTWLPRTRLCDATSMGNLNDEAPGMLSVVPSIGDRSTTFKVFGASDTEVIIYDVVGRPISSHALQRSGQELEIHAAGLGSGVHVVFTPASSTERGYRYARFVVR